LVLDLQGWITVVAGLLLALITLFTSYDHVDLPALGAIPIDQQIGVPLLVASLAALAFEAELASRRRLRDQERNRAAEERERALRRAQRQDRCTLEQLRYQLDPSAANARRLADLIALLQEYGDLA
jgi:hypothetical protein